jgi:RsiW-degrading membrane proteinase PrsW (M82 family)
VVVLAAVAAGLPTMAYLALVWWVDRYEKEPLDLLAVAFLWGALPAALLVVSLEASLEMTLAGLGGVPSTWGATRPLTPLVEEIIKGSALLGLSHWRRREFNGVLDGIIYGAFVGLGFALTENFFAFLVAFADGSPDPGPVVFALRGVVFGLNHPLFSALFGAGLGWARYQRPGPLRAVVPLLCLLAAVGLHLLHNALAAGQWGAWWAVPLATLADWSGLALIGALIGLAWVHERRWIEEGLGEEVRLGTVTADEYRLVISHRNRRLAEWRALRRSGWARYRAVARHIHVLTELAFARYHERHPDLPGHAGDLNALRAAVRRGRLLVLREAYEA